MNVTSEAPITDDAGTENLLALTVEDRLNLILTRHGEAGGNGMLENFGGAALSQVGEAQADRLAARLAPLPLDGIYASDHARSYQTGKAVSAAHPKTSFHVLSDIREISVFNIRGRPPARTREQRERLHEQRERVKRFAEHLRCNHKPGQRLAIVAHNGLNGMLLAELTGLAYRQCMFLRSCHTGVAVANVALDAPLVDLRLMGCMRHLPPQLVTWDNISSTPQQPPDVEDVEQGSAQHSNA